MRRIFVPLIAAALSLSIVAVPRAAHAAELRSATCSATAVATINGISAPSAPACSLPIVACPADSAGCAFTARMSMTATTGLGASRGQLRITDPATNSSADFYCGGPATTCHAIQPTSFFPAGYRLRVSCSATKDNILVNPKVSCSAGFQPLGEE